MILNTMRDMIAKYNMLPYRELVLLAVSGGADSMCLLTLMAELAHTHDFSIAVVHFNHHLRGAESDRDARFVDTYCRSHNISCYTGEGDVSHYAKAHGLSIEEAARDMRYQFFFDTADKTGATKIATAHTADDNLETVLLNLTRGSGLRGLCGIPPVRGKLIRPLLLTTRKEIEDYLIENEIPHVADSSNFEDIYNRNKIRHNVIPILQEINPKITDNIHVLTESLRDDELFLSSLAEEFINNTSSRDRISINELIKQPTPVIHRILRMFTGIGLTSRHTKDITALCTSENPSAQISLPKLTIYREYEDLVFTEKQNRLVFEPVEIQVGQTVDLPVLGLRISCSLEEKISKINKSLTTYLFKYDEVCGKIFARPRKTGDKIMLPGRNGSKSLKKLFIEEHIAVRKREALPVLSDEMGVIAVYKMGTDKRMAPNVGDTVLKIMFEEII